MNEMIETKEFTAGKYTATVFWNKEDGFYREYYFRLYDGGNPSSPITYYGGEEPTSFDGLAPKAPRSCGYMFE